MKYYYKKILLSVNSTEYIIVQVQKTHFGKSVKEIGTLDTLQ